MDNETRVLLVHLALKDEVRGGSSECGRAPNAGGVTHTQTHPFGQKVVLGLQRLPPGLQRRLSTPLMLIWSPSCEAEVI